VVKGVKGVDEGPLDAGREKHGCHRWTQSNINTKWPRNAVTVL
jgi:hypothetical protein